MMKINRLLLFILNLTLLFTFWAAVTPSAIAQGGDTQTGPINDAITALAFDKSGYLWVGTEKGLTGFDGQTWKTYTTEDSSGYNKINAIVTDEANNLWAGTGELFNGNGVSHFDGQTWTTYSTEDGLKHNKVNTIAVDQTGHIWVGTGRNWHYAGGVSRFDGEHWTTYTTEDGLGHNSVNAIAAGGQGTVWFGTADGVSMFDGQNWTTYNTEDGLAYKWVSAIAIDHSGRKWFGTIGGGITVFDGQTWITYTAADALASNVVYTLRVDQSGQIWAGTSGGISKYDGTTWSTYTTQDGLPSNHVRAIAIGLKGDLWLGTDKGLDRINASRGQPSDPILPTLTATAITSTQSLSVEVTGSRVIDKQAKRIYARGKVNEEKETLVLDWTNEALLATYNLAGKLTLDSKNAWLYIDQGVAGLAVVNSRTEQFHALILLPEAVPVSYLSNTHFPSPQADPETGRVMVFRDNVIYIVDPLSASIVDTLAVDVMNQAHCSSGPVNTLPQPINWTAYDRTNHILYLDFLTGTCTSTSGANTAYTIVSYNMASKSEIDRGGSGIRSGGTILGDYLYQSTFYCISALCQGYRSVWREGQPWFVSAGWRDGGGPIDIDPNHRLFYEVTANNLRVFEAETMALTMHLPRPFSGTFEGYNPETDQLEYRLDGQLQSWPAGNIQAPPPEPLFSSPVPTTPLLSLAVSPNWTIDQTLFGIWDDPIDSPIKISYGDPLYNCVQGNQRGNLLYISQDSGQTWGQPLGGLQGSCKRFATLAVSPDYAYDQTLLAGVFGLGIFKSTDGGQLWKPSGAGLTEMNTSTIMLSPHFAADQTAFALSGWSKLYRSTDGGQSWQYLNTPARQIALSPNFDQDHTLISLNRTNKSNELYISRDKGDSWELINNPLAGVGINLLSVAPLFNKWHTLFVYGWNNEQKQGALYRSTDEGRNWEAVLTTEANWPLTLVYATDIESNRPVFLLAGETIYRSNNGGQTWAEFELPTEITPTALSISPNFAQDGLLFVGTSDGQVITMQNDNQ